MALLKSKQLGANAVETRLGVTGALMLYFPSMVNILKFQTLSTFCSH